MRAVECQEQARNILGTCLKHACNYSAVIALPWTYGCTSGYLRACFPGPSSGGTSGWGRRSARFRLLTIRRVQGKTRGPGGSWPNLLTERTLSEYVPLRSP